MKDDGDTFIKSPVSRYDVNESILVSSHAHMHIQRPVMSVYSPPHMHQNEYHGMILLMMFGKENIEEALKIYPKTHSIEKQLSVRDRKKFLF